MLTASIDQQIKVQKAFWFCVIILGALGMGYLLAADQLLLALAVAGGAWMMTLPYHSKLSSYLAVATFSSALIVPLFPGRPYVWEFAALLGWSGLTITVMMRQYARDSAQVIHENRWLYVGMLGYCAVLMATMMYRGVGLRILGSGQMGGRFYFQQMTCVIFPFLFVMYRLDEKTLYRLFVIQMILTFTYFVSDFAFSFAPEGLFFVLQFFELPGDAVNFEYQSARMGIRRFQSLYVVGSGMFFLLLLRYNMREFLGKKALILIPAAMGTIMLGMLSGHRFLVMVVLGVLAFCAVAQKFFDLKNTILLMVASVSFVFFTYAYVEHAPLSVQRAASVLPGIHVDPQARQDGDATLETRRQLRRLGVDMMPQYFWMGRGFGLEMNDYSWQWDPSTVTMHANSGRFFNGFIGLMVNTGIPGTFFMGLFLLAGTVVAYKILKHIRRHGCDDNFSRMCTVLGGMWVAYVFGFTFLHGDSEYAMKTFSLLAGLLLACWTALQKRLEVAQQERGTEPVAE